MLHPLLQLSLDKKKIKKNFEYFHLISAEDIDIIHVKRTGMQKPQTGMPLSPCTLFNSGLLRSTAKKKGGGGVKPVSCGSCGSEITRPPFVQTASGPRKRGPVIRSRVESFKYRCECTQDTLRIHH